MEKKNRGWSLGREERVSWIQNFSFMRWVRRMWLWIIVGVNATEFYT